LDIFAMNCSEIQKQLSAYHDRELTSEMRGVVAAHVAGCQQCALQLAQFTSYSKTFSQLPQPDVPATVWAGISAKLDQETGETAVAMPGTEIQANRSWTTTGRLALAASVLLVLGLGFWMAQHSDHSDSQHAEFATTMDHYLKTLADDPDQAERFLLEKYDGQTVDPKDAIELVGYRPAIASGLPEEYTLASTSVMRMPCCTCVKAVCKRKDGSTLVLFEHDDEETEWFGARQSNTATCGDTECCLVDLDSSIAATWKRGSRWVTAVGVRDTAEVSELVTWLEDKTNSESQSPL
jgi:hypothetical protein